MENRRRIYGACVIACALIAACGGDDDGGDDTCTGASCPAASGGTMATGSGGMKSMTSMSTGGTTVKPMTTGGSGGAMTTGSGGMTMMAGGSGGTQPMTDGGVTPPGAAPMPSTGCGVTDFPAAGNFSIDVDGTSRDYIVALPDDYDPNKPHKLIFAWHGLGGTAMQIAGGGFAGYGYYGLQQKAEGSAIFVAGQGLETSSGGAGWPNSMGRDIAFVRAMLDWLLPKYCVDEARIFSVGMSYGGIMSNTIGCELGDVFRAIAPMSGSGPRAFGGGAQCVGQVAVWSSHGDMDDVVSTMSGLASRDHWVMNNHCTMDTMPVDPAPCVAYQGCDPGFPVTWCLFEGGHTVPMFASQAIWDFFSQF